MAENTVRTRIKKLFEQTMLMLYPAYWCQFMIALSTAKVADELKFFFTKVNLFQYHINTNFPGLKRLISHSRDFKIWQRDHNLP
jgi:hypothetical protein